MQPAVPEPPERPNIDVGAFEPGTPFSRWALARYIVGRVLLERISWALAGLGIVLLVVAALCEWVLHSTFLAVIVGIVAVGVLFLRWLLMAVLRRLMLAQAYGPLEKRLDTIVSSATGGVLAELRRVGLPGRVFTVPLIAFRLIGKRRQETLEKMRAFDVDRAVPKARRDELHLLLQEATGRAGHGGPTGYPSSGPAA